MKNKITVRVWNKLAKEEQVFDFTNEETVLNFRRANKDIFTVLAITF